MSTFSVLRIGVGAAGRAGWVVADRDAVANGDLLGADEDVLDEQPQDSLAFGNGRGGGLLAQAGEEVLEVVGESPKAAKTRIVHLTDGGEGVDFLGFHHRLVTSWVRRGAGGITYLARWPSRQAMQHARDRIRDMTMRSRLAAPVEQVVQEINTFLRGWVGYFRYGNSAHVFDKIRKYAELRVALFIAKRHKRGRAWGLARIYRSPDALGLINLNGSVIAPRPNRPWRAPVEHRR